MPNQSQAKDEKIYKDDVSNKPKKKGKGIILLIVVLLLVGLGAGIYLNRDSIAKVVKDVPVLNQIFKVSEENTLLTQSSEELAAEISKLESQIQALQINLEASESRNETLQQQVTTLSQYEKEQAAFVEEKQAWQTALAKENPNLYIEQYELMEPELAQMIYKDLIVQVEMDKAQKQFANTVAEMDPEQAAKALEVIIPTDPELIQLLFNGMVIERKAEILSAMESSKAAQVIKLISPELN